MGLNRNLQRGGGDGFASSCPRYLHMFVGMWWRWNEQHRCLVASYFQTVCRLPLTIITITFPQLSRTVPLLSVVLVGLPQRVDVVCAHKNRA